MDSDRVFVYEFEKSQEQADAGKAARISKRFLYIQSALLYSTSEGQRRIRCHNIAVPLVNNIGECYNFLDITATTHLLARKALSRFDKVQNIEQGKVVIESSLNNMARAF